MEGGGRGHEGGRGVRAAAPDQPTDRPTKPTKPTKPPDPQAKENWGVHALLDARAPFPLVTGQNPASSGLTAELVVEALGGHKAGHANPGCEIASHV